MKKYLIINPGSTSTKISIFNSKAKLIEKKIFKRKEEKAKEDWLKNIKEIEKISFRIVHGGELKKAEKINSKILKEIEKYTDFAPIHNKIALEEIKFIKKIFPKTSLFAYFDTAFHQNIKKEFFTYPIKPKLSQKYKIRKYGFHGIALESVLEKIKEKKRKVPKKIIALHLGGGSSITGIKNGKSFITSMELTPISGIMMTTRVGNVDSDLDKILSHKMKKNIDEISNILNYESGFYGLTGTKDVKKIFDEWKKDKNSKYALAVEIYLNQIIEKVSAYVGILGGVDLVTFSGGIGYKNEFLAKEVIKRLKKVFGKIKYLKIDVDEEKIIFKKTKSL